MSTIREHEPEARLTYFPAEGTYMVHVWGRPLSSEHATRAAALEETWRRVCATA